MAKENILRDYGVAPPDYKGAQVSLAVLFCALLASPLAWSAQLLIGYGLASHACFPSSAPKPSFIQGWEWTRPGIIALNLACLFLSVVAAFVSYLSLRRLDEEKKRRPEITYDIRHGRSRFFATWGLWAGGWFALQILFATIALLWVRSCGG